MIFHNQTSSLGNHVPHMDILGYFGDVRNDQMPPFRVLMRISFHHIFCNKTADSWNWFTGKLQETREDLYVWGGKKNNGFQLRSFHKKPAIESGQLEYLTSH